MIDASLEVDLRCWFRCLTDASNRIVDEFSQDQSVCRWRGTKENLHGGIYISWRWFSATQVQEVHIRNPLWLAEVNASVG
ncbi:MAG: hypothetical protein P8L85_25020 [Rubripirellula sp.]|nr:hypothetical protein [Rubripirellula sp.]